MTMDREAYKCSMSAETIQVKVTKAWCHPIVMDKIVNTDLKGTSNSTIHIQLLAKLKSN